MFHSYTLCSDTSKNTRINPDTIISQCLSTRQIARVWNMGILKHLGVKSERVQPS